MSKYKVLSVPCFFGNMEWVYRSEETTDAEVFDCVVDQLVEDKFERLTPVFNRDGWYYDRLAKRSWYEWKGTAWTNKGCADQFLYELSQHDARMLEPAEVKAIRTLMVYGSANQELLELLWQHEHKVMLRNIYRDAILWRIRLLDK